MDQIGWIRRLKEREKKSVRQIARMTGLSRNTVAKWLQGEVKAPKYERRDLPGKLNAFEAQVVAALKADARRPLAERRTARALLGEIRAAGYQGGYSRLTDFIRAWRQAQGQTVAKAFVPLSFELGEAFQFDWSEEGLVVGGIYYRLQVAHTKLCASRAFWLVAYPGQGHEMLFDAHKRAFAALGGVARRGIYDLHVDGGRPRQEGPRTGGQRALRGAVCALPVRAGVLQRCQRLGEGPRGEERAGQSLQHLAGSGQAALRLVRWAPFRR